MDERIEDIVTKELISEYETKVEKLKNKVKEIELQIEKESIINHYKAGITTNEKTDELLAKYGIDLKHDNATTQNRRDILIKEKEEIETVIRYCNRYVGNIKSHRL